MLMSDCKGVVAKADGSAREGSVRSDDSRDVSDFSSPELSEQHHRRVNSGDPTSTHEIHAGTKLWETLRPEETRPPHMQSALPHLPMLLVKAVARKWTNVEHRIHYVQ